ncbi:ferredoxin-type protein NapF [Thalassotalea sp. Y01]|uniref:ferredoxin-type protein NapF n=1 Tax=Thalassotalea sp. Y01 TaxID=2729613 RepID=UPI00145FABDB|nr:ferredoxin-type protein NapF [Thalassotalea sp. Y01]NMP15040.1 ferredoxin-type protein NapF [Thalassotalea sp. Y01]
MTQPSRVADVSRRNFLRGRQWIKQPKLRLPWVINEKVFLDGCTQCGDCLSACPENILVKSDDGFVSVDFNLGECTFCEKCVDVCEQPLFKNTDEQAWSAHLNIKDNCLASNQIYCQSCKDVCDTRAIEFHYKSSIPTPSINQSQCTSCGACVNACPSQSLELIAVSEVSDE